MKKFLLSIAALSMMAFSAAADEQDPVEGQDPDEEKPELVEQTVRFGYIPIYEDISYYPKTWSGGPFKDQTVTALIYLPEDTVKKYAGFKVTKMFAVSGRNLWTDPGQEDVNLFIEAQMVFRKEIEGRSFYSQPIKFTETPLIWNTFELNEPFVIEEDTPFYAGYTGINPSDRAAPYVTDGFKKEDFDGVSSWQRMQEGIGMSDRSKYNGSLMIQLELVGMVEVEPGPGPDDPTSVTTIGANVACVNAVNGGVMIEGNFNNARIYDYSGTCIAETQKPGIVNLPKGLYLVNVDNTVTTKIMVK